MGRSMCESLVCYFTHLLSHATSQSAWAKRRTPTAALRELWLYQQSPVIRNASLPQQQSMKSCQSRALLPTRSGGGGAGTASSCISSSSSSRKLLHQVYSSASTRWIFHTLHCAGMTCFINVIPSRC